MKHLRLLATIALWGAAAVSLGAAINPEEFKKVASDVVKLREIARIEEPDAANPPSRRRLTLVGEVTEVERGARRVGEIIVIDYTVDLAQRAAEARAHQARMRGQPGPQFMHEPDPPKLDDQRELWAHLAPVAGRLANVNRHAGRVVNFAASQFSGPVFVPVAGQYSWDVPSNRIRAAGEQTYTGVLKAGVMAIGGETTGVVLETDAGVYELDLRQIQDDAAMIDRWDGKRVTVVGEYQPRRGVEVAERRIIVVRSIREAH